MASAQEQDGPGPAAGAGVAPSTLHAALRTAGRLVVGPSPHRDYAWPLMRAVGRHGFRIQDEVLRIPSRWGFFSPGPSRLQAMEGCLFAGLLATVALVAVAVVVCACRGESREFMLCCAMLIPVAFTSTYIEARQYRQCVPLSWTWQTAKHY